jgi:hypothetical protein
LLPRQDGHVIIRGNEDVAVSDDQNSLESLNQTGGLVGSGIYGMYKKDRVWIAASVGPLLVMAVLLSVFHLLRRWYPQFPEFPFLYMVVLALGVGMAAIGTLSISVHQLAFVLILYVPLMILVLFVFLVTFGCLAFGYCL